MIKKQYKGLDLDVVIIKVEGEAIKGLDNPMELRSKLGPALRDMVCMYGRNKECKYCTRAPECVYAMVYEPWINNSTKLGPATPPPPFIIRRFDNKNGMLEIAVLSNATKKGRLQQIVAGLLQAINKNKIGDELNVKTEGFSAGDYLANRREELGQDIVVLFLSPIRMRKKGKVESSIELEELVKAARRRARLLVGFYGRKGGDSVVGELLEQDVSIGNIALFSVNDWVDGKRFSKRQNRAVPVGGVIGSIEVNGIDDVSKGFLIMGELLNIGKGASNGLGAIQLLNLG